jgi:general secretion pathway protein D
MHNLTKRHTASNGLGLLSSRFARYGSRFVMSKLSIRTFSFALVSVFAILSLVATANAGPTGLGAASTMEDAIARRQQQLADSERMLNEGMAIEREGKLEKAVLNYQAAYTALPDAAMTRTVREASLTRFCSASVRYAEELIEQARYDEALASLTTVVDENFAPGYPSAKKLIGQLNDPEYYNRALSPDHIEKVAMVETLLRQGDDLQSLGQFEKSRDSFNKVLRIDSTNSAARSGMENAERAISNYHLSSRDHTRAKMLRDVDEAWETGVPLNNFSTTPAGTGESISGLSAAERLDRIIVPIVNFDASTLQEVVDFLTAKSRELDPLGGGFNFVLDLSPEDERARSARLGLQLRNIPMSQVLSYVTRDSGTAYRAEQFAVRIVSSTAARDTLVLRTLTVPADFFSVASDGGAAVEDPFAEKTETSGLSSRIVKAQEFFEKVGITFPEGASANYTRGTNQLRVRNTITNIESIERMIQEAKAGGSKNVEVRVTLMEIKETKLNELGFDWLLGSFNFPGSDRVFGSGGTRGNTVDPFTGESIGNDFPLVPPGSDVPVGANPITAGNRSGTTAQPNDSIDGKLFSAAATASSTRRAPAIFDVGGVLTDPQLQAVMRALNQNGSTELITTPATVVRPGQRSKIEIIREFIYPTEYDPPEIPQNFSSQSIGGLTIDPITGLLTFGDAPQDPGFPVTPANPTAFEMRPVGTTLEVEPIIGDDGVSINLNLAPEVVRFEGFINYGSPITSGGTILTPNEILQPIFNTIKQSSNVTVYDGANLVIGGLINDRTVATDDRTPIFSSMPVFGNLFRTRTSKRERKAILFIVNVRIIDASGHPVNER